MDFNIEIEFVKKHIKKEYQDRLLFELQSQKHREKAISRFSHNSEKILKNGFKCCNILDLKTYLFNVYDSKKKCYVISNDENDGKMFLVSDAIEYLMCSYMTMILISENFVVVKEEYEKSPMILISTESH